MISGYSLLWDTHVVIWMATAPKRLPVAFFVHGDKYRLSDIAGLSDVRSVHRDPFDRLLISQAVQRPVYLATPDGNILRSFEMSRYFYLFADEARVEAFLVVKVRRS